MKDCSMKRPREKTSEPTPAAATSEPTPAAATSEPTPAAATSEPTRKKTAQAKAKEQEPAKKKSRTETPFHDFTLTYMPEHPVWSGGKVFCRGKMREVLQPAYRTNGVYMYSLSGIDSDEDVPEGEVFLVMKGPEAKEKAIRSKPPADWTEEEQMFMLSNQRYDAKGRSILKGG
jgi:hypothetical protein